MMKIGIDSYCFHRFFGEVYPQQQQPPTAPPVPGQTRAKST
jgi:hypothetical protein